MVPTPKTDPGDDATPKERPKYRRRSVFAEGDYFAFKIDSDSGALQPIPECPGSHKEPNIRAWLKENAHLLSSEDPVDVAIIKFHAKMKIRVEQKLEVKLDEAPRMVRQD